MGGGFLGGVHLGWSSNPILFLWACGPLVALLQLAILWPRRDRPGAIPLILLMVGSGIWVTGELLELGSATLATKILWAKVRYLGIVTIPVAWFMFSCHFGGRRHWLTPRNTVLLNVIPAAALLLVWSNEYHGLIWAKTWIDDSWLVPTMGSQHGLAYYVLVAYTYVLVMAGSIQLFQASRQFLKRYRYQAFLLISAIVLPLLINFVYQLRLGPIQYLDYTPLAIIVSGVIFSWNFLRGGLLPRPMPLARDVVLQSMLDGVIVVDLEHRILDVNPAARAMLELSADVTGEKPIEEYLSLPEALWDVGPADRESGVATGNFTADPRRFYDARVSPVYQRWAGHMGYVIILQDTTERRGLEADRRRSYTAMEQTGEGIAITDSRGIVEYVNPRFTEIMGYARDELVGQDLQTIRQGAEHPDGGSEVRSTIERRELWKGHSIRQRKDGTTFHEEATLSPMFDDRGEPAGCLCVIRDTTQHVQMEEMLRQSLKMEAIGHLAGGVAHDFNNLLAPILGFSDLIREELALDHPHMDPIQEIQKAAKRARTLTRQLLAFSRKQVLEIRTVNINDVVTDLEKLLRHMLRENIEFTCTLDPAVHALRADVSQLEQVLINLVVNAQDAMPEVGSLSIVTSNYVQRAPETDTQHPLKPGDYVRIEVSDSGCGMPPQVLEHVFEPFFTTKSEGHGTGLGLATVLGIVHQHEGHIAAVSQPGRGTQFSIYLPAQDGPVEIPSQNPNASPGKRSSLQEHRILLVEDNEIVRRTVAAMLSRLGYRTDSFPGGRECLDALDTDPVRPTLLVTDVIMPGQNGKEVYEALKLRVPDLKVLYISGYTRSTIEQADVSSDDGAFLHKPFTKSDLKEKLETLLRD